MDEPFMPGTEALYGPEAGSDNDSATADGGAEPGAGTGGRVRAYDPQAIADPAARRRAWERLYGFVEYLNSTWGALRNSRGVGDYYIRAGWWTNPIIVAHLAALQGEYAEAWLLDADRGAGATLMLRAVEHTESVLVRVTGKKGTGFGWSQDAMATKGMRWDRSTPPAAYGSNAAPSAEARRAEYFRRFLDETNAGEAPTALAFFEGLCEVEDEARADS